MWRKLELVWQFHISFTFCRNFFHFLLPFVLLLLLSFLLIIFKPVKMSTIVSRAEIDRIINPFQSTKLDDKMARKAQLKELSEKRMANWPNTLDALRRKKESFIKDRDAEEELRRQQIDREVCFDYHFYRIYVVIIYYLYRRLN